MVENVTWCEVAGLDDLTSLEEHMASLCFVYIRHPHFLVLNMCVCTQFIFELEPHSMTKNLQPSISQCMYNVPNICYNESLSYSLVHHKL